MDITRAAAGHFFVGTAGWSLPLDTREAFGPGASVLARYATRLMGGELNSRFSRPHKAATYARWAAAVPPGFRFSVKLPRAVTHECKLADAESLLDEFLTQAGQLHEKLGCLLVQLPPSLALDEAQAERFFLALRQRHGGAVVVEPRHRTWFSDSGTALLASHGIGLVQADPPPCREAADLTRRATSAEGSVAYYRLHGSPRMYYSAYEEPFLQALAQRMKADVTSAETIWCIFDNTASGAATADALSIMEKLTQADQNKK
jgi:uncharacterized protein YecE (DUF72 family)